MTLVMVSNNFKISIPMQKNRFNIKMSLLMLLFLAVFQFSVTSCSDNDNAGNGTPEITGVRVPDPTYADSLFSKSSTGQMIAIMGNNLANVLKVYINDQEVSFNSTMNTDHSVIVSVPTEEKGFKLTAFNSTLKDEIRVETTHGDATYSFKITAPGPQFQRIDALYPRNIGDTLRLNGLNLVDVEDIYITDLSSAQLDTTVWKKVGGNHTKITNYWNITQDHHLQASTQAYETTSVIGAVVPENAPDSGALVIECAAGTTYLSYSKLPGKPVVKTISSDMPEIGEDLILTGREFVQVGSITDGDVALTPKDYKVSSTLDTITIPFKKIPTNTTGTTLKVTTPGGVATVNNFYDKSTILTTFDGDAIDNGWTPNASYVDGGTADGKYAYINVETEYQQWWGTMIYFRKDWNGNSFSFSDNIPSTATADHLYLSYECYDTGDYNNGSFWGFLRYEVWSKGSDDIKYDNFGWKDYDSMTGMFPDGPVLQDIKGKAHKNHWYRTIVPLSKFSCYKDKTLSEIKNIGLLQFRIQDINESTKPGKIQVKIDNVSIIYIP